MQWFETSWRTMQRRTPDLFHAGYGAVWTPPPGRALYDDQGGGIGYNLYDRFDLGKAERHDALRHREGLPLAGQRHPEDERRRVRRLHPPSRRLVGCARATTAGAGSRRAKSIQDRSDYPGFELSDPYVGANSLQPELPQPARPSRQLSRCAAGE